MNKKLTQDIFKGKDKKWKWASIDGVNSIPTLYTHKPKKSEYFSFYANSAGEYQDLREDTGYSTKNWEDSLIEREAVNKISKRGLQKDIELLESGIAMNWSDMKKIETRLNHEISGMQTKLNELNLQIECQQSQLHLAAKPIGLNRQAILRIENKDEPEPQLKTLDQSAFDHPYATDRFKYVALNSDGQAVFFESKPVISNCLDIWVVHTGGVMPMLKGYDTSDWQNSLIEREPQLKQLDQSVFDGIDKKWRFASVDEGGTAYRYTKSVEPYLYAGLFRFSPVNIGKSEYEVIGGGYDTSDWQDSVIGREDKVKLTGSDLTRALKKERTWVLAYVSNENDVTAEFHQRAVIVTGITDSSDFICSGGRWRYAVAVNHNGKILSAKEVGII